MLMLPVIFLLILFLSQFITCVGGLAKKKILGILDSGVIVYILHDVSAPSVIYVCNSGNFRCSLSCSDQTDETASIYRHIDR